MNTQKRTLVALRTIAELHVKEWQTKAWAQSHGALFHEDPSCRPKCLEHANLYHGRALEAQFWAEQIQSAIYGDGDTKPESTIVDKQAEATAAAVVLGEEKELITYKCIWCRTHYDKPEANARMRICCGDNMVVARVENGGTQ